MIFLTNDALQKFVDAINESDRRTRSLYQFTLGKLMHAANTELNGNMPVHLDGQPIRLDNPHSYRGYYSDLAFEDNTAASPMSLDELRTLLDECHGKTFEGYKGGDNTMGDDTPLWIAEWGCTSNNRAIMDVDISLGYFNIKTKFIED